MELKCSEMVSSEGSWGFINRHRCTKKVVIERDGKSYCKIHDPEYIEEKNKALQVKWDKEREFRNNIWKRESLAREIFEGVETADIEVNKDKYKASEAMYEALKETKEFFDAYRKATNETAPYPLLERMNKVLSLARGE